MNNQRYGMLFDTSENSHYFFDAGTGKVVSCTKEEKEFIDKILKNQLDLASACKLNAEFGWFIKQENLFSDAEWHFSIPTKEEYTRLVKGHCQQIVLELTEACNLRCKYCIYNEHHPEHHGYSNKTMSFETAKKSIDLILSEYKGGEFALSFYGGEPLVNFPLMKKCIEYARSAYPNVDLSYSFTTNLTLLTPEMVDYFKTLEDIDIMCSLDGPKAMHDKYRVDINGEGTFDKAIENFKLLLQEFYNPDKKRGLLINCVIVPPYTKEKLNDIYKFFFEDLKIPEGISCNYSYVDLGNMQIEDYDDPQEEQRLQTSPLEEWAADDFLIYNEDSRFYRLINMELYRVANRAMATEGVIDSGLLHGNCIPGQRRVYVTVDGNFRTCEKVGNIPSLGNCDTGFDYDKSYQIYIEGYAKYYEPKCNECWARNQCSLCYDNAISADGDPLYLSGKLCQTSRELVRDMFINYFRIFEKDREGLAKAVNNIKIK